MKNLKIFIMVTIFSMSFFSVSKADTAIFAGGCFWCMQAPFDSLKGKGVNSVIVGYTGGTKENPSYKDTSAGGTGHREAIEVNYDPRKISYSQLLKIFWENIDPYDQSGQFCDKGEPYTSAVFYNNEQEKLQFEKTKPKGKVATLLLPAKKFYPAEEYHQSYYIKNPIRYKFYRFNCGRDKRLKEIWGHGPH
ncbi:MAG: peptide-methionine (S)-S-oxide reductase MsrA [Bacteriovorax sp.]|nr:peptide-methionine (S)-S-oxide reductase MsrA [Bacteriovorax sp.]